jgi:hypothetical protein
VQAQAFPFDLHVLSTPPAFVLSQDQTLHKSKISPIKSPTSLAKQKITELPTNKNQSTITHAPATTGVATSTHNNHQHHVETATVQKENDD